MKNLVPGFIFNNYRAGKLSGEFKSTVMFIDIVGFTGMTQELIRHEKAGIETLSDILNDVFGGLIKLVHKHGGWIGKFEGDAFTVFFKSPDFNDHLQLAEAIQGFMQRAGKIDTDSGSFSLNIRIGIGFGDVNWRVIETDSRNIFYFKGPGLDDSYKAESECLSGEISLSDKFREIHQSPATGTEPQLKESTGIRYKKDDLIKFVPQRVLNLQALGEFRDIVSVFIRFEIPDSKLEDFLKDFLHEIIRFNGYLNKLDYTDKGPILLTVFGAPTGLENPVNNALEFCLSIRSKFPGLSFGVARGTVYAGFIGSSDRGEYTVLGDVVNLSARLMSISKSGEISTVSNLVESSSDRFDFSSGKKVKLKGFDADVEVFNLTRKKTDLTGTLRQTRLVGRKSELGILLDSIKPLAAGKNAGVLYIDGDPGIGKSKLVEGFFSQLNKKEFYRLELQNDRIIQKPFYPFISFLRNFFDIKDDASSEERKHSFEERFSEFLTGIPDPVISGDLPRFREAIGSLLNITWPGSIFEKLDAESKFNNMISGLKLLVKAQSIIQPVILEFDDAHWSDDSSREVIRSLTVNTGDYPIFILIISRTLDDGTSFRLKDIDPDTEINEINLGIMTPADLKELVNLYLEKPASQQVLDIVKQKSEYNPFFIEQIVLYLKDSDALITGEDDLMILNKRDFKIPRKINNIIISRIDRLNERLKEIIKTASVIGREFSVVLLSRILKNRDISIELHKIEDESIWLPLSELQYIFKHVLIREAVYDMQLRKTLKKLHKTVAESLEQLYSENLEIYYQDIAYHFEQAGEIEGALKYYKLGADHGERYYQTEQTIFCMRKLIDLTKDEKEKLEITTRLAGVLNFSGDVKSSESLFKSNLKVLNGSQYKELLAENQYGYGELLRNICRYDEAIEYLKIASNIFQELGLESKYYDTLYKIGTVHYRRGLADTAMEYFEQAYDYAKKHNDQSLESEVLGNLGNIAYYSGNIRKASKHFRNLEELSYELDDIHGVLFATVCKGNTLYAKNQLEEALEIYKQAMHIANDINDVASESVLHSNIGVILFNMGRIEESGEFFKNQVELSRETENAYLYNLGISNLGDVYLSKDNFDKALECYSESEEITGNLKDVYGQTMIYMKLARLFWFREEFDRARGYFEKCISKAEEIKTANLIQDVLILAVEFFIELNDIDRANEVFDLVLESRGDDDYRNARFSMKIIGAWLNSFKDSTLAVKELRSVLEGLDTDEDKARTNYVLFMITGKEEYRAESLELFNEVFKVTPFQDIKHKIIRLKSSGK